MEQKLRLLPKGIQSFQVMREGDYIYVDKTQQIYSIISSGKYYFLSRPRRFGKSLLISTLAELFSGNKKLFDGLWIEHSTYQWEKFPVVHFSFSSMAHHSPQALRDDIAWNLKMIAKQYNIDISEAPSLQTKLILLIKELATNNPVVVLVDEYDYSMISNINDISVVLACSEILRDFFAPLKDLDKYLKFVFITGVSKFSKTSIFSGLNNLEDLTISKSGVTLLGYTHQELLTNFESYIKHVSEQLKINGETLIEQMNFWYDGYQFDVIDPIKVYNPYSVLLFFNSGRFLNYWFETGTPSFLINLIKNQDYPLLNLDLIEATHEELNNNELDDIAITPLLFQAGYLTLDDLTESGNYRLRFPNYEVKSSFLSHILKKFTKLSLSALNEFTLSFVKALKAHDVDLFCRLLQTFFAEIPSTIQIPLERYYQTILFVVGKFLGLSTQAEVSTNIGRIDMVVEISDSIYIFEFKLNGSAQAALAQIKNKHYYQKYLSTKKHILLIGVNFDTKKRNLDEWEIEKIS